MKNNDKVKDIAIDILNNQELPEDKFGSVIMILMMVSIIVGAIRAIQECNKNKSDNSVEFYAKKVRDISDRKWWFAKMRLRKIMRNELSTEDYKAYAGTLCEAIFNKGVSVTDDEIKTLLETINND